jgi:hypothetical protein
MGQFGVAEGKGAGLLVRVISATVKFFVCLFVRKTQFICNL